MSTGEVEGGGFGLAVALDAALPGLEQDTADDLVRRTHELCLYSRATDGNVPIEMRATT